MIFIFLYLFKHLIIYYCLLKYLLYYIVNISYFCYIHLYNYMIINDSIIHRKILK